MDCSRTVVKLFILSFASLARLWHVSRERRRALRLGTCDVATIRSGLQMRDAVAKIFS
jgi:hypothetical protein